jgi:hypothetical protein
MASLTEYVAFNRCRAKAQAGASEPRTSEPSGPERGSLDLERVPCLSGIGALGNSTDVFSTTRTQWIFGARS